jgi:hypothetical protein
VVTRFISAIAIGRSLKACFIRRILVVSNAIQTIDNEMINLIKLHYLLTCLNCIQRDRKSTYKTGLRWLNTVLKQNGKLTIQICIFGLLLLIEKQKVSYWYKTTSKEFKFLHSYATAVAMATTTFQDGWYFGLKVI